MEVHIGRESVSSWKDFAVRYLLIVAGILSAWAVNQWNEWRQHQRVAEQARSALHEELSNNLAELRKAMAADERAIAAAQPFRKRLIEALAARRPQAEIDHELIASWQPDLRAEIPTLRRDAWEAAIAGQALMYMAPAELRRWSSAYATMRDVGATSLSQTSAQAGVLQHALVDWVVDRRIGRADPLTLARLLQWWETLAQANLGLLASLDEPLSAALEVQPLAADTAASAASR